MEACKAGWLKNSFPFCIEIIYDAVQYIYEQPYVLKDADGNGIIGVTGHSMGGGRLLDNRRSCEGRSRLRGERIQKDQLRPFRRL